MTHHAKLGRWLQLGGHCDGDADALAVACREAEEESGLGVVALSEVPIDIDIHTIPARGVEPRHFHYDVRFVLQVRDSEEFVATAESLSLAWVPLGRMRAYTEEESVLRLVRKFLRMARRM